MPLVRGTEPVATTENVAASPTLMLWSAHPTHDQASAPSDRSGYVKIPGDPAGA